MDNQMKSREEKDMSTKVTDKQKLFILSGISLLIVTSVLSVGIAGFKTFKTPANNRPVITKVVTSPTLTPINTPTPLPTLIPLPTQKKIPSPTLEIKSAYGREYVVAPDAHVCNEKILEENINKNPSLLDTWQAAAIEELKGVCALPAPNGTYDTTYYGAKSAIFKQTTQKYGIDTYCIGDYKFFLHFHKDMYGDKLDTLKNIETSECTGGPREFWNTQ